MVGSSGQNGRPEYVKAACDASLQRLASTIRSLLSASRRSRALIEDSVGAMADLVRQGPLLDSQSVGAPSAALMPFIRSPRCKQSTVSRDVEAEILPTVRELGIGFVAYSPLGRGFLTGQITRPEDIGEGDWRKNHPRFQGENLQKNLELLRGVAALARSTRCTPAQLALAWLLAKGDDIVRSRNQASHLPRGNVGAPNVTLMALSSRRWKT
jgi:aryl-alcohol dehydrogenase-like predicted oxidoreductase